MGRPRNSTTAELTPDQIAAVETLIGRGLGAATIAGRLGLDCRAVKVTYKRWHNARNYIAAREYAARTGVKIREAMARHSRGELPPPPPKELAPRLTRPPMGQLPQDALSWDDFLGHESTDPPGHVPRVRLNVRPIKVVRSRGRHNGRVIELDTR